MRGLRPRAPLHVGGVSGDCGERISGVRGATPRIKHQLGWVDGHADPEQATGLTPAQRAAAEWDSSRAAETANACLAASQSDASPCFVRQ